jgi:hypothetical protein
MASSDDKYPTGSHLSTSIACSDKDYRDVRENITYSDRDTRGLGEYI